MTGDADNAVRTTERSLDVVEALKRLNGARLTELAEELDFPNSTVHNHLTTLLNRGYVVKQGHQYHIGLRFLNIGEYARRSRRAYGVSMDELDSLSSKTDETAALLTEENGTGIVLYTSSGPNATPLDLRPGKRIPLHTSGIGRAYMAYLPNDRIEAIADERSLSSLGSGTGSMRIVDRLQRVRDRGYDFDRGERHPGVGSVGAAVKDENGNVVASIGVAGASERFSEDRIETLADEVRTTANIAELHLAHS